MIFLCCHLHHIIRRLSSHQTKDHRQQSRPDNHHVLSFKIIPILFIFFLLHFTTGNLKYRHRTTTMHGPRPPQISGTTGRWWWVAGESWTSESNPACNGDRPAGSLNRRFGTEKSIICSAEPSGSLEQTMSW